MKETYTVTLLCVFCDAPLQDENGKEYQAGELIKCDSCGEDNDYGSVYEIAKDKGLQLVEEEVLKTINQAFKSGK